MATPGCQNGFCSSCTCFCCYDHANPAGIDRAITLSAALVFLKKALKRHGRAETIVTDGLKSYPAAMHELGNLDRRELGRWLNNRAENSHLPFRRRERAMLKFREMKTLQKFCFDPRLGSQPLQCGTSARRSANLQKPSLGGPGRVAVACCMTASGSYPFCADRRRAAFKLTTPNHSRKGQIFRISGSHFDAIRSLPTRCQLTPHLIFSANRR